jgi:hypothetical protein
VPSKCYVATRCIVFLSVACLSFQLCRPLNAQDGTQPVPGNRNDSKFLVNKAENFARPAEFYSYLLYDRVVPSDLGPMSQTVRQPLPVAGGSTTDAVPISEPTFRQFDLNRVPQSYELFRPGKTIAVEGNQVLLHDEGTKQETVLIDGPDVSELRLATEFARTALSPNGRQLAAAVMRVEDYNGFNDFPLFDVYVVDLFVPVVIFPKTLNQIASGDQHKPKLIGEAIRGEFAMSSSLLPDAIAPPLFWADEETVILLTPIEQLEDSDETAIEIVDQPQQGDFSNREDRLEIGKDGKLLAPTHALIGIHAANRSSQNLFELKLDGLGWRNMSVDFWRRSDGAIMLRNAGQDMRIDLEKRKAIEERRLSPRYELRGDRFHPSLWCGEELLCESLYYRNVGVSPDGHCIAWYARSAKVRDKTNLGNTSQYLTTLWFHSPETGTVELAEGKFFNQDHPYQFDNPQLNPSFHWISEPE